MNCITKLKKKAGKCDDSGISSIRKSVYRIEEENYKFKHKL